MKKQFIDRGMKKWTSMMLPEHVALLKEWREEDAYIVCPELSPWELEQLQESIIASYTAQSIVTISTWEAGKNQQYEGVILSIDTTKRVLHIQNQFTTEEITLEQILRIEN